MELHDELLMRLRAFIQSVANVCPSCVRRSDATCPVCVCKPAARLLSEIEHETGTAQPNPPKPRARSAAEVAVLRFIRGNERAGATLSHCINRVRIKGLERWEKARAIKHLVSDGLIRIVDVTTLGGKSQHAFSVEDRRREIDKELSNV